MSFKFPFSTYHELNLDWILKKVETLSVNAEADANTIATYEERLQTAETQAQNAETSAANAQSAATSAASVAENALTIANSAQSSADASGALASQAATKADAAQIAADSARQAAETAQATAANFDGRITSAEQQASEALNMAQSFDEQARAAITTANNAANVATEAQATANATALELARQRTALETIGSQQTAAINSAGASQVTAINNAGQAVLDSLPADYMNGVELVKDYTLGLYPQIETDYASILSFDNGADNIPVKELNVNIIPYQEGTGDPSPSNIRTISGWTGVEILKCGKNLVLETIRESSINAVGVIVSDSDFSMHIAPVKKGIQYIITSDQLFTGGFFTTYPSVGSTTYDNMRIVEGQKVFVAPITGYVAFRTALNYASPQLEFGIVSTPYDTPKGSRISVTFPTEAGTVYGGTLTINQNRTGILIVNWAMVDMGVLAWSKWSNNQKGFYAPLPGAKGTAGSTSIANGLSSEYTPGTYGGVVNGVEDNSFAIADTTKIVYLYNSSYQNSDVATFKSALSGVQLAYELANSVSYMLSETEISSFLSTLYGVNNVWADAGNTSITYRADLSMYITENSIANYTRFASMIAGVETGLTASKTYSAGDYFILGQKLYKALTNIATGATFTLGTNCEETTVGAELVLAQ